MKCRPRPRSNQKLPNNTHFEASETVRGKRVKGKR